MLHVHNQISPTFWLLLFSLIVYSPFARIQHWYNSLQTCYRNFKSVASVYQFEDRYICLGCNVREVVYDRGRMLDTYCLLGKY